MKMSTLIIALLQFFHCAGFSILLMNNTVDDCQTFR